MSASAQRPWTRFIKRAIVQGGGGGKDRRSSRSDNVRALIGRLRRLEVVVLFLAGHREYMRPRDKKEFDLLLEAIYTISDVEPAEPGGGSSDARTALPVSHSGPADGQGEGDPDPTG